MIQLVNRQENGIKVSFVKKERLEEIQKSGGLSETFKADYLEALWLTNEQNEFTLYIGIGEEDLDCIQRKEIAAKAVKLCKEKELHKVSIDITDIINQYSAQAVFDLAEGAILGQYNQRIFKDNQSSKMEIEFCNYNEEVQEQVRAYMNDAISIAEGICFARDMVNLPANRLRPRDFAQEICDFVKDTSIETEVIYEEKLREMGMDALLSVGESSQYPPCMLVMRYKGDPSSNRITGLVGKGVTVDTGGYCLKPSNSMLGIKGDMAGGAAVSAALYALAKNQVKTNAVAVIPMCENRISSGSMLPGDVIRSYSGKTIEIINTDAEGRLILADAVSYAVKDEGVTEILDIATLTGAVVNMLGFSIGGAISDDDKWFDEFYKAYQKSGERYWRLPFYKEHEKMIESKIADIKNLGESHCGTITAGLFIRAFAKERPWLHLDIAGTAWVEPPIFEFQTKGATGAGVSSIYHLCNRED
ncbi:MAG: leucyl aminopeptidase [Candidatus Ruminococcus intestinipullorum]|nr:leucyl aminopeptidase [Candidatus Ruminococcus intestinipullorum]